MRSTLSNTPGRRQAGSILNGAERPLITDLSRRSVAKPDHWSLITFAGLALVVLLLARPCQGQDIEPRRWSHIPIGTNFTGGAYAYSTGDTGTRTQARTGSDVDTFTCAFSVMW